MADRPRLSVEGFHSPPGLRLGDRDHTRVVADLGRVAPGVHTPQHVEDVGESLVVEEVGCGVTPAPAPAT